ncbi:MAG: DUF3090 family protein [Chloroflexi bacterium]|nr:DUF3090 family protein [Chloroflexota bacterium]OJW06252.1 MAG: hypothetical protein BGO39_25765 [Chloroflexi bacterium 54-19]
MAEPLNDFGPIDELKPEAIGVPGNRRFRLLLRQGRRTACFWMEKQQLGALADAVSELLTQVEGGQGLTEPSASGSFPEPYEIEVQTGRLALGYNEASGLFLLLLYDIDAESEAQENASEDEEAEVTAANMRPTLRCEATRAQLEKFYSDSAQVIQAGRPPKPSKNGHFHAN